MEVADTNREEEIRHLAYRVWQEEGRQDGYDVQHWLKAETIWLEKHRPRSEPKALKRRSVAPTAGKNRKSKKNSTAEINL
jgi:hypothetical protein